VAESESESESLCSSASLSQFLSLSPSCITIRRQKGKKKRFLGMDIPCLTKEDNLEKRKIRTMVNLFSMVNHGNLSINLCTSCWKMESWFFDHMIMNEDNLQSFLR
jgi:hypothetical protein